MMLIKKQIQMALSLLENPKILSSIVTWPVFSLTSFLMVSRLKTQGIDPKTVLDVGANVGQFAVAAAKLFPNAVVYSFEPDPESVKKLRSNVKDLKKVSVYPIALGDRSGELEFHVNAYSLLSSIFPMSNAYKAMFPKVVEKEVIRVNSASLDEVSKTLVLAPPVLLKIDVEGYEARTLAGARHTLAEVDYIVVETSFKPMYSEGCIFRDILEILERQNFSFLCPVDFSSNERTGEIYQMDTLFVRNDSNTRVE